MRRSRSLVIFWPKCRSTHPENYLFSLSKKIFSGSKHLKKNYLILKKEALVPLLSHRSDRYLASATFQSSITFFHYSNLILSIIDSSTIVSVQVNQFAPDSSATFRIRESLAANLRIEVCISYIHSTMN